MRVVLQRVKFASVSIHGKVIGKIGQGMLLFVAIANQDTEQTCKKMVDKLLNYRLFSDDNGKMNLSIRDIQGDILIVSQFTLLANTKNGRRPDFSQAPDMEFSCKFYQQFVDYCKACHRSVATGEFGADMQVSLINDGPVTFQLES